MKQTYKPVFIWIIVILAVVSIHKALNFQQQPVEELPFSEFHKLVEGQKVESVDLQGNRLEGVQKDGTMFRTMTMPPDSEFKDFLIKNGVQLKFKEQETTPWWQQAIISWLPMIFLFVVFFFFMRQLQAGGGKAMSFGKSKAKLLSENQSKVTFDDVAGIDEAKDELQEIIAFLKDPKKYTRLGGRIPKGVLLMGSPGTGKTLLARAIAGEAGVPFFSISGSDFVEMFVGVGASRVRDLFEQGKKHAPCIIFIDEIDAVGRHRGAGLGGGHDEREQTLNQLLVEMDGFESSEGVILIAATNRPDVLDPALMRPGRFDRRVTVPRPDLNGRLGILKVHVEKKPISPQVELEVIARGTPGFSGADLENLVNEAALLAARNERDKVIMDDFEMAKDKVLMGRERRSMFISEDEKKVTAYHEAGHALVAILIPGTDPVHKVTIIPRGMALGLTQQLATVEKYNLSKTDIQNTIAVMLGGRCAEEIIFKEQTTGASNDFERATDLARRMVCEWGMSQNLGPITFGKKDEQIFLGKEISHHRDFSEKKAIEVDEEVSAIIRHEYDRATKLLQDNIDKLKAIAEALLEYETLDGNEINLLMSGSPLTSRKASTGPLNPLKEPATATS